MEEKQKKDMITIIEQYFPGELDETPFQTGEEQWEAWSCFVDMLCGLLLLRSQQTPPQAGERIGSLMGDGHLSQLLQAHDADRFTEHDRVRSIYKNLLFRGEVDIDSGEEPLPLWRFFNTGLLIPIEQMAFLLALCAERSCKYGRLFAILQEQESGMLPPTVGLVHDLCSLFLTEEENFTAILLDDGSYLNRILLREGKLPETISRLNRPLVLGRQAYFHALGTSASLGILSSCATELFPEENEAELICNEKAQSRLIETYAGIRALSENGIIFLEGESGTGKTFLMHRLASAADMGLLVVYADRLLATHSADRQVLLQEIVCRCLFEQEMLFLTHYPSNGEHLQEMGDILLFLQDYLSVVFLGGTSYPSKGLLPGQNIYRIQLEYPDARQQKRFWELFPSELFIVYDKNVNLDQIVSKYSMTQGRIKEVLSQARLHASPEENGIVLNQDGIENEIRNGSVESIGDYAVKLSCPFTREDLQLTAEGARLFSLAMDRIRFRSVVNVDYGFGKKVPYGNGTTIVFYGPPGTGKTMAAQVLAKELGLDIYRVDLSQIEDKYIGESSKKLKNIFDTMKRSNAILFFDEADALFAKRTEVADSNDKHANAETAFLLQKLEEYDGISILATNIISNFDKAFKRRMTFMIPVQQPNEQERLLLWEKVFPKETPLASDVDFSVYARLEDMTGSTIKAAALSAAYRAAAKGQPVSHMDIVTAIDEECKKSGRLSVMGQLLSND